MSYPLSLDEITSEKLKKELDRRFALKRKGRCHYCERPLYSEPTCKMVQFHQDEDEV